jgi:hypothetical protein
MRQARLDSLFRADYAADRAAFKAAVERFAARSGRRLQLHTHCVDRADDLQVTAAELAATRPERLYVLCTGIHGIEGYAGSAIARHLLETSFAGLDPATTSVLIVHALNPYGFANFVRVNAGNVDLNRNCAAQGEALFETDSTAYAALSGLLAPQRAQGAPLIERARFQAGLLAALLQHGADALRQASLAGQYIDPCGIFFGGSRVEPEIAFFQGLYEALARAHDEVLLTDLHTGYGVRGEAYPLFGRADSESVRAFTELGVSDASGQDKAYTVYGDLVGYCYLTAKRVRPQGTFNGLVIELGTHGLSLLDQLRDLYTVVSENRLRQLGASDSAVRGQFRELFYPSSAAWRDRAVRVGGRAVERVLCARGYLPANSAS